MLRFLILAAALLALLALAIPNAGPFVSVTGRHGHNIDPDGAPLVGPAEGHNLDPDGAPLVSVTGRDGHNIDPNGAPLAAPRPDPQPAHGINIDPNG